MGYENVIMLLKIADIVVQLRDVESVANETATESSGADRRHRSSLT